MTTVQTALYIAASEAKRKNNMLKALKALDEMDKTRLKRGMIADGIFFTNDNWKEVYVRERG